ncbi:MAG: 30S ribosomal protein S11 [Alphaproteobacteria bacterium]|jgi:small subunit ribosomal protein S11|uniref:30S ribosomal protein S11 n=1 Tax=Candidatus Megaera polyxenophila TaxID=988779 RepID=UPI001CC49CAA|nr:30S ribosomal protein S11 [Candidatus Megaera polyxenophila]MBU6184349.1 30S ribosomal protein S11 [Rickettsiales bacterium]MCE2730951.1 30S ribosomal protein S11 [Rickettsiaceae bacterium]NBU52864.1 30S ribosomal protein S11 [Alphaproteobacteria bacterium]UCM93567.1 MAG: 30S ribosomal protein S11 [Candidatus Megaira endosymbiont of Mesostigma viride]HJK85093.1 30S ribosomal protein S11 [Candidatus Megaera endosymbiont of Stentor roeselii]
MSPISKIKKKKKNISLGVVHIKATFNNTIVTFTDIQGNVIAISTAGSQGFKGAKKATPHAAQLTVDRASENAKDNGMKTVSIRVKGAGSQREAAMRAVFSQNFVVTSITDVSGVAHNGVRPPKRRRV